MDAVEVYRRKLQASLGPENVIQVRTSDAVRDLIEAGLKYRNKKH